MLSKIFSSAVVGLKGLIVGVEIDIAKRGLPTFTIVGLPDKAVEESKDRVKAALANTSSEFPNYRITVNLAPADLPKQGPIYDLPIAVGILASSGQLGDHPLLHSALWLGELSLDGTLRSANGILSCVLAAKELGLTHVCLPEQNAKEAAIVPGITVVPITSLRHAIEIMRDGVPFEAAHVTSFEENEVYESANHVDFSDIYGQEHAKRAMIIAAAGSHNILLKGPPGSGKTMLARALASILPPLSLDEAIEVTKIYSIIDLVDRQNPLIRIRQFRSPHHTTSRVGLVGGGQSIRPGEISLAHRGVLFLDEFPEFPRHVLESLRQPLEEGIVSISRASGTYQYPARFTLVAAANPCPCGNWGSDVKECTCSPRQIQMYQKRLSGPLLDRIDLQIDVPAVEVKKILQGFESTTKNQSHAIRERVMCARTVQSERYRELPCATNAELQSKHIRQFCPIDEESEKLLHKAIDSLGVSVRGTHKLIKIARTIADLEENTDIRAKHIAEALSFRMAYA